MRVQIFEPFSGGHHTNYVAALLPTLTRLAQAGSLDHVILTTSSAHASSADFADRIAPFSSLLQLDTVEGDFRVEHGRQIAALLVDSVRRTHPDFVISTSANNGAFLLALRSIGSSPLRRRGVSSVGIFHHGFSQRVREPSKRLRDLAHRVARRFGPWSEVHIVNPVLYQHVKAQGAWSPPALRMLPDPVEARPQIEKTAARAMLGIPTGGYYIGQIGKSDGRKAIPELLAAFRAGRFEDDVRLLFAGQLYPAHRALLEERYGDLIAAERIVLLDRYLRADEFHVANCASDVVSVAYYTDELSANLLAATAACRPVIASREGYTGMMIRTFDVGWSCDVKDHDSFLEALRSAVREGAAYRLSQKAELLLDFHDPQNFVDTLLQQLYPRIGVPAPSVKTWDWALGCEGRQTTWN